MLRDLINRLRGHPKPAVTEAAPTFDGVHSRNWWATRDNAEASSAQGYWDNRAHPAREAVAQAVAALPGDALLEVGVHAGPTLWAIAQRKRFARLAGTELSPVVLDFARATLPGALGMPVQLDEAAADKLPYADKSFDIVVSAGVLLCIGPDDISASLMEMLRVCRGHLVLAEPFSDDPAEASAAGRIDVYPNTSYWVRNYQGLLRGRAELVSAEKLPPEKAMGHIDSVLVFKVRD